MDDGGAAEMLRNRAKILFTSIQQLRHVCHLIGYQFVFIF
jgi:hypothetical protein